MRIKFFSAAIWVMISISSLSQTSNSIKGFSELKLNYNLSFISEDPFTTNMGLSIGSTYTLNKNFSINAGFVIKPTKKEIADYDFVGDWIVVNTHTHQELTAFFIDIPIHVDYKLFNIKSFSFFLSSGPRLFYLNTSHELIRTTDNQEPLYYKSKRNNLNLGLDLGFVQKFMITGRIGLFAAQHYGQALLGYSKGFESTDLDFGMTYKLK
jgi:hypothetical protein